jgi:hypothetical protein
VDRDEIERQDLPPADADALLGAVCTSAGG